MVKVIELTMRGSSRAYRDEAFLMRVKFPCKYLLLYFLCLYRRCLLERKKEKLMRRPN